MRREAWLAYLLWFFLGSFGAHRIYCGKFISGFLMMGLFWLGVITKLIFIGWFFLGIWGLWWLIDVFLTAEFVNNINSSISYEDSLSYNEKLRNVQTLYELYKNGAISEEEYKTRKEILMNG